MKMPTVWIVAGCSTGERDPLGEGIYIALYCHMLTFVLFKTSGGVVIFPESDPRRATVEVGK